MLSLIKEINEKVQLRNEKQREKRQQHTEAEEQIKLKQQQLQEKEKEYNLTLDENILTEIKSLKDEIKMHEGQKEELSSTGILEHEFRYPYDKTVIIQELDNKLKDLNFDKLKDAIVKAQTNYIRSLEDYNEAVKSLLKEKNEVKSIESNVDIEVLRAIQNWFTVNYQGLHISSDLKVGNTNNKVHNIEQLLFDSIQDNVNRLDGDTWEKFESLK